MFLRLVGAEESDSTLSVPSHSSSVLFSASYQVYSQIALMWEKWICWGFQGVRFDSTSRYVFRWRVDVHAAIRERRDPLSCTSGFWSLFLPLSSARLASVAEPLDLRKLGSIRLEQGHFQPEKGFSAQYRKHAEVEIVVRLLVFQITFRARLGSAMWRKRRDVQTTQRAL